jgi:hypothetical protein
MPFNTSAYSPDGSVSRVLVQGAAHHQDLRFADPADPPSLVAVRRDELLLVKKWVGATSKQLTAEPQPGTSVHATR